jgi:chlorobactene glucosyltransferase
MSYLLIFSLLYLMFTLAILVRNRFSFKPAGGIVFDQAHVSTKRVSVCIPARNEASVIARCVESVLRQDYPDFEVIVLNDGSSDQTGEILERIAKSEIGACLRLISGASRPDGWLGKPWACEQLGLASTGDIIMFIDADTWLEPGALQSIVREFTSAGVDALTIWPRQHTQTFWEKVIIPMVYFALLTLLPVVYVKRDPRWMPGIFRKHFRGVFAAACGQCIAFSRSCYQQIGRHEAVKAQVVEDVELAKAIKRNGLTISMHHGIGQVNCRMYTSDQEILMGFRKNFLAGFGNNIPFFIMAAVLHILVFIVPYITVIYALIFHIPEMAILATSAVILIHIQRWLLDRWNGWSVTMGLTHLLGVLWFQRLGIIVLADKITGKRVTWKGRDIRV